MTSNALERGVELFNAGRFWEAHEAWEEIWLCSSGDEKQFLQALIQLAAAYHHCGRGTLRGAVRLFDAALRRLEPFADGFFSIDRHATERAARLHRAWAARPDPTRRLPPEQYPKLHLASNGTYVDAP